MPTYEYFCQKCEKSFDAVQSMKDPHFTTCPQDKCRMEEWGHGNVKRQLGTGAGLIFKGSGFYITDYRSEGYKEAAKKDAASGSASGSTSEGKGGESSPAKPDAATPAKKTESAPAPAPAAAPAKPGTGGSGAA